MLIDDIKNIESSPKDLKKFGMTLGIFFALWGGILLWRKKEAYLFLLGLSVFFLGFGFIYPKALKPVQKVWMGAALLMGWVMTRVILSALFYLVIFPIGFLTRAGGRDFLNRKWDKTGKTYWMTRDGSYDKTRYEKQF